jgi:hypothetical protein
MVHYQHFVELVMPKYLALIYVTASIQELLTLLWQEGYIVVLAMLL